MAKKQTLKSLLGGGDGRVQASLNLGTPKLQPTIGRGGQSVTATQATLSAGQTSLGKLATSLEKLNPALQAMQKGYYAEAEKDKLLFQEKFAGMDDSERQALVQAQEANLAATEDSINNKLRGQYGLNPLAGIYAEKLVGASESSNYNKFISKKLEAKKLEIEKLPWEKRPTAADMEGYINELTQEFLATGSQDGGELFQKGTLRYEGFLASTAAKREELKLTVPKTLEDHHKDTVFIPSLANNLRNVALGVAELEAVDGTQPNNKRAILNTYLRYLNTLDIADTKKVLTDFVDGFAVEDADFAKEALAEIAQDLKIGNEPLVGSSLYNNLLATIEAKEDAWRTETLEHNAELVREYKKKYLPELRNVLNGEFDENNNYVENSGGLDAADQYIKEEIKKLGDDAQVPEAVKEELIEWFKGRAQSLESIDDTERQNISEYLDNSSTSMNALSGDTRVEEIFGEVIANTSTGYNYASNPLFKNPVGLENALLDQRATSDAQRFITKQRGWLQGEITNLQKKVLRMNLPSTQARADWVMEQINAKGGLNDQFKDRLKNDFESYLHKKSTIQKEETRIATEVQEKADKVQAELAKIADPDNRLKTFGGTRGVRLQYNTGNNLSLFVHDEVHIPKMIDKYSNTAQFLKDGDANLGILAEAYDEIYTEANEALPRLIKRASTRERRETLAIQAKQASEYQLIKGFAGYEPVEIVDILESGFEDSLLSDENGISYNTDYFQNSYKNIRIDGLAEGDEATKVLATLLGISVDQLIKSQNDYRTKFRITN
jgi:hypothetical protein